MSAAVQPAAIAPDPYELRQHLIYLGPSQLKRWSRILLGVVVGGGLMTALFGSANGSARVIALFFALPTIAGTCIIGMMVLALLAFSGGSSHRLTRNALEEGRIGITYLLRDPKGRGYVVVDEDRRLIAVNGDVFGFDEVRQVGCQDLPGGTRLDFTLRSGPEPVRSAVLGGNHYATSAYAKVVNTLGLA